MDIICEHCQAKLTIADQKIPKGKRVSFLCPKCREKIYISSDTRDVGTNSFKNGSIDIDSDIDSGPGNIMGTADYDASDKPFDFLDEDDRTMLLCMKDNESKRIVEKAFSSMDYKLLSVNNVKTALTRMKYHIFDTVVIDEEFDKDNKGTVVLLNYMNCLNIAIRRRIFAVFVSNRYRTMDNMAAFHASVNLIINRRDIDNMGKIFLYNIKEYEKFYSVFKDSLKNADKI